LKDLALYFILTQNAMKNTIITLLLMAFIPMLQGKTMFTCDHPTGLSTTNITTTSATCNWAAVSGAANYRVNWHVVGNATWQTALVSGSSLSYMITGLTTNTNYEWKVKTLCGSNGESDFSEAVAFTTAGAQACTAPTDLSTTNITANSATFNWAPVANALHYRVSWHVSGTSNWLTALVTAPTTSYTTISLTPNTAYEWKVKTLCDGGGESDNSPALAFSTAAAPQACNAPTGLTTTDITTTSAIFHWNAVAGAVNYRVNWHVVGNSTWQTALVAAPATAYTVTGLTPNTNYEWKVKTLCVDNGESDFSPALAFKTLGSQSCTAPTGLTTNDISATSAIFHWNAVAGAINYRVNWHPVGSNVWQTTLVAAPATSFTATGLTPNTAYEWKVKTLCTGGGESDFSPAVTFTTLGAPACAVPTDLSTTDITATSAIFHWHAVTGAANYRVNWHVVGSSVWHTVLVAAPATSYTATGLVPNTTYEWKVKTLCTNGGESDFSPGKTFTTLGTSSCAAPTGLSTTNITAHSATFNWGAVTGAVNYRVNWHVVGSNTWQTVLVPAPATSFTANGLIANTNYEWKVKTLCTGGGESDFSPAQPFKTLETPTCAIPVDLSTTNITANSAVFHWNAVPGAANYRVNWHVAGTNVWQTTLVAAPATSYTATGLVPNTTYEWKVKTLCTNGGESDFSPGKLFTTLGPPACTAPTGLTTNDISATSAIFHWNAVAGAANYRVNWHIVGSSSWQTTLVAAPATSFTATGLTPSTNYEWKVKTLCTNGGESDFSPGLTFMTHQQLVDPNGGGALRATGLDNVAFWPNPADKTIEVQVTSPDRQNLHVSLINPTGKLVKQFDTTAETGSNKFKIEVADLPIGLYILQLDGTAGKTVKKVMISH
jgi:chitodextrinase